MPALHGQSLLTAAAVLTTMLAVILIFNSGPGQLTTHLWKIQKQAGEILKTQKQAGEMLTTQKQAGQNFSAQKPQIKAHESPKPQTFRSRFPNGIVSFNNASLVPDDSRLAAMSLTELELAYEQAVMNVNAFCSTARRIGLREDGGWDLCLVGPYVPQAPCFSFSFGVNNIWGFDDEVAQTFKCQVVTFDPSMKSSSHQRGSGVIFIKEGIHSSRTVINSNWKVDSYAGFLSRFNAQNFVVDILKMDVEAAEWPALTTALEDGSLRNVKQLLIETHMFKKTKDEFVNGMRILRRLHSLGFRLWHHNWNIYGNRRSTDNKLDMSCCHELYFVNVKFFGGNARNAPGAALKNWKEI